MRRRLLAALGVVLGLVGLAASAGSAYAYFWDQSRTDLIAAGVQVAGVPVGGLRATDAESTVRQAVAEPLAEPLRLVSGDWSITIDRRVAVSVDVNGMVGQAVAASRSGSLDDRLLRVLRGRELSVSVPVRESVSAAAVDRAVAGAATALDRPAQAARAVPSAKRLRIVASQDGVAVKEPMLRARLQKALLDPSVATVTVPIRPVRPKVTTAALARRFPSYLLVDRKHFKLRLYRHLKLARTFTVAVGQQGLETPAGLYRITDRQVDPSWHVPLSAWAGALAGKVIPPGPADPIKARWLGFYDGAGIHGTDELSSLGTAASHGCIRMRIPDVIALYPLVPLGTPIYVG